jgi:hypothetical protein
MPHSTHVIVPSPNCNNTDMNARRIGTVFAADRLIGVAREQSLRMAADHAMPQSTAPPEHRTSRPFEITIRDKTRGGAAIFGSAA